MLGSLSLNNKEFFGSKKISDKYCKFILKQYTIPVYVKSKKKIDNKIVQSKIYKTKEFNIQKGRKWRGT